MDWEGGEKAEGGILETLSPWEKEINATQAFGLSFLLPTVTQHGGLRVLLRKDDGAKKEMDGRKGGAFIGRQLPQSRLPLLTEGRAKLGAALLRPQGQ